MALLTDLKEEETLLKRWITASEDVGRDAFDLEGAIIRLGRVRAMIESIEGPLSDQVDHGGWEDH